MLDGSLQNKYTTFFQVRENNFFDDSAGIENNRKVWRQKLEGLILSLRFTKEFLQPLMSFSSAGEIIWYWTLPRTRNAPPIFMSLEMVQ